MARTLTQPGPLSWRLDCEASAPAESDLVAAAAPAAESEVVAVVAAAAAAASAALA